MKTTTKFALHVMFKPIDRYNPVKGYRLLIVDVESNEELLNTIKHPVSGKPLSTVTDCLEVISYYVKPHVDEN